jgi:endonuclease/exonuclease/phosphatase family metal-dependent hydrolase
MHIVLVTYNIHACIGTDGRFDLNRIVNVLREISADVVALQEVEHHAVNGYDLLDYISEKIGLTAIAGPTLLRDTRHYGNALLTNFPISTVDRIDLSVPGREPRGALDVMLSCNGQGIRVVATHLGLHPKERRVQARQLLSLLESQSADISVLMGDLNEWFLWGRILRWLHRHFQPTPHRASYPARWPVFALDRLWVNPRSRLTRLQVHTSDLARTASDHLPLIGIIES